MRRLSSRRWPATVLVLALAAVGGWMWFATSLQVTRHEVLPQVELGEPSFYPTLEAHGAAPILDGNRVEVLLNGEHIFPAIIAAIRAARRSVAYAQYFYEDGPVARDVADALADRCRAGLDVNILLDGVGTLSMPSRYVDALKAAGCDVAIFRPVRPWTVRRANARNHRRILVIDGRTGFTGGSGVSEKWMGNGRTEHHWRDTDVKLEGPAVAWLQSAFAENWLEASGEALGGETWFPRSEARGNVAVQVVRSSPAAGTVAMYTTFLIALASARRSIRITNPYFILDDRMADVLIERVRRGVTVEVLVPGAIDHNLVRSASRATWGRLLTAGIAMYEYRAALLHAKTMVVDGALATIGSTNLDNRSFALNEELNVMIYDRDVARRMDRVFAEDVRRATPVTFQGWRHRGLRARLLEALVYPVRDLL